MNKMNSKWFRVGFRSFWILLGIALSPMGIFAQCTKDADCKFSRICEKGSCVESQSDSITGVCNLFESVLPRDFVLGPGSTPAKEALKLIGDSAALTDLPEIRSGSVTAATAMILGSKRLILYNTKFLERIESEAGKWPVLFVLAHELGHHVNADVYVTKESKDKEFRADEFAAKVMTRLKATREETLKAFEYFPQQETALYPSAAQRRDRTALAYEKEAKARAESVVATTGTGPVAVQSCQSGTELVNGRCRRVCAEDERRDSSENCVKRCDAGRCREWDFEAARCVSSCSRNQKCDDGSCEDIIQNSGLQSGGILFNCNCWGYAMPGVRSDSRCQSGYSEPFSCNWVCPAGGVAWGVVCR